MECNIKLCALTAVCLSVTASARKLSSLRPPSCLLVLHSRNVYALWWEAFSPESQMRRTLVELQIRHVFLRILVAGLEGVLLQEH